MFSNVLLIRAHKRSCTSATTFKQESGQVIHAHRLVLIFHEPKGGPGLKSRQPRQPRLAMPMRSFRQMCAIQRLLQPAVGSMPIATLVQLVPVLMIGDGSQATMTRMAFALHVQTTVVILNDHDHTWRWGRRKACSSSRSRGLART